MAIIKPTKPYTFTNGTGNTANADEVNEDFDTLYSKIEELIDILNNSAGTKTALANRLAVAINDDGTLKSSITAGGEWVNPELSPLYVSATQFTVSGDQTDIYLPNSTAGRRLKITLAASTVYSAVTDATYSAGTGLTTVTCGSVLTDPLTSVEHGIHKPVASLQSSLPRHIPFRGALVYNTVGAVAGAVVPFTSESYDTDSLHDNTTNSSRLTVPTGVTKVKLTGQLQSVGTTSQARIQLLKNGSAFVGQAQPFIAATAGAAVKTPNMTTAPLTVTAGDYFEIKNTNSDAGADATGTGSWFAMEIIE